MRAWIIYVLLDPRTNEVRYVGVTHGRTRLAEHVYSAKRLRTHTATWVRSLVREGLRPLQHEIERGVGDSWADREKFWIAEYRRRGASLTNHTDGGEGTLGWSPTSEQRAKMGAQAKRVHTGKKRSSEARARMREARRQVIEREREQGVVRVSSPRTPETLARMSAAQQGKKHTVAARENMSRAHKNPSVETRAKIAQAVLCRPAEQREAFATNQRGVPKSTEHKQRISDALKAAWARRKEAARG